MGAPCRQSEIFIRHLSLGVLSIPVQLGVLGDGDPVDVVEIGSAKLASG